MREHNRLTRVFREKETKIRNSQQQRRFKENPMKFGKELFQKRNSGEPTFTSQIALDYFAKLYRDEQRDFSFTPLPEMVRPSPPTHILSENAPTQEEIMQVLRCCPRPKWYLLFTIQALPCPLGLICTRFFLKSGKLKTSQKAGPLHPSSFSQNPTKPLTLLNFVP